MSLLPLSFCLIFLSQATKKSHLQARGITQVINCAKYKPSFKTVEQQVRRMEKGKKISVLRLKWKDKSTQRLIGLVLAVRSVFYAAKKGLNVLIHCAQGKSRSGSVMIAYMMTAHNMSFQQAFQFVRVS